MWKVRSSSPRTPPLRDSAAGPSRCGTPPRCGNLRIRGLLLDCTGCKPCNPPGTCAMRSDADAAPPGRPRCGTPPAAGTYVYVVAAGLHSCKLCNPPGTCAMWSVRRRRSPRQRCRPPPTGRVASRVTSTGWFGPGHRTLLAYRRRNSSRSRSRVRMRFSPEQARFAVPSGASTFATCAMVRLCFLPANGQRGLPGGVAATEGDLVPVDRVVAFDRAVDHQFGALPEQRQACTAADPRPPSRSVPSSKVTLRSPPEPVPKVPLSPSPTKRPSS